MPGSMHQLLATKFLFWPDLQVDPLFLYFSSTNSGMWYVKHAWTHSSEIDSVRLTTSQCSVALIWDDWLLKGQQAEMLFPAMIRLCTLLCLVVFVVGPVQNEIVFGCTHASNFWSDWHMGMKPSRLARECEIEKTEVCEMEGGKWMEWSRQNVRGGKPNMAIVHHLVPDGAPDGASRATNHPLCIYHEKMQFLVWIESNFYIFNKFIENIFHGESNYNYLAS